MTTTKAHQWWLILLISLIILVLSVWVMVEPVQAFAGLALVFAWFIMLSGLLNVIFALQNTKYLDSCLC